MRIAYVAPTMFRGYATMTRKQGIVVNANAGRGKLGARETLRFRLLTCLPLRKGVTYRFAGRMVASGPVIEVQTSCGAVLHLAPIGRTMKEPY